MNLSLSASSNQKANEATRAKPPKIPRLDSFEHQLKHAKDADGRPLPLLDDLLFFLEDPPAGTGDRWQEGANLCGRHGIKTSRMSVWRFYRAHIVQWRSEQYPPPPPPFTDPDETDSRYEQAHRLAAQRTIEMLNDPALKPGHLISFLQNDTYRLKLKLANEQFDDRVFVRHDLEHKERIKKELGEARYRRLAAQLGLPIDPGP